MNPPAAEEAGTRWWLAEAVSEAGKERAPAGKIAPMRFRPLIWGLLLVAAAFSLSQTLVIRHGVGPIEYVVGVVLVVLLAVGAFRAGRRAVGMR